MDRLVLGLSLLLFFSISTQAQDNKISADDASAVRVTVTNYIEAFTPATLPNGANVHPHYLKHKIHGDIPMTAECLLTPDTWRNSPGEIAVNEKSAVLVERHGQTTDYPPEMALRASTARW